MSKIPSEIKVHENKMHEQLLEEMDTDGN